MLNMSPLVFEAPPPSPACIVMPGTLRSASVSVCAPCSSSSARGMTWIVCGVSVSGALYLVDSTRGLAPLTSTAAASTRISTTAADASVNRCERLLPSRRRASAWAAVSVPLTPAVVRSRTVVASKVTRTLVTRSNSAIAVVAGGGNPERVDRRRRLRRHGRGRLPPQHRHRLARRPDPDVRQRRLQPGRFEDDAAIGRERGGAVLRRVERGEGGNDGPENDPGSRAGAPAGGRRRVLRECAFMKILRIWRRTQVSARMRTPGGSRASRVIRVGPTLFGTPAGC